jgi:antitoxin ParD1/3/4
MPTRNISLTSEQDAFVSKVVDSGEYQNASEAIRDALRSLQQRRKEDQLKLKALRAQLAAGAAALDRGDFIDVRVLHERMEPGLHVAPSRPKRRPRAAR